MFHKLKVCLHDQSFPSKTWSQFSLSKFFDRVNLHQKLCQRSLMDFDRLDILTDLTNRSIKKSFQNQDHSAILFVFEFTAER